MKASDVKILIVDDEPMLLEAVADLFKLFQFQVHQASSGNQAWELLKDNAYDLVLSDVRMPDGDGIELTHKIKARNPTSPSVIFMSGFSDLLNEEIYHIGVEGKFKKPFDFDAVRGAIELSLMAPEHRWAQPFQPGKEVIKIEKVAESIEELEEQKSVVFGRGGFFISHAFAAPEKGSTVLFSIEVKGADPVQFRGAGYIRWNQNHGKSNVPPGLGIEIVKMHSDDAKNYQRLFGQRIPFIPSLARAADEVS
jgi:CheY-like chemotaxis protein